MPTLDILAWFRCGGWGGWNPRRGRMQNELLWKALGFTAVTDLVYLFNFPLDAGRGYKEHGPYLLKGVKLSTSTWTIPINRPSEGAASSNTKGDIWIHRNGLVLWGFLLESRTIVANPKLNSVQALCKSAGVYKMNIAHSRGFVYIHWWIFN